MDSPASESPSRSTRTQRQQRAKSRGNGEGSVYLERASGRWVAAATFTDALGRVKRKRLRFTTRADAQRALTKVLRDLDSGIAPSDDRLTVEAFLKQWLAEQVEGPLSQLRPATRVGYATAVHRHLIPVLGRYRLSRLSPDHVTAFLAAKLNETDDKGRPVLTSTSVRHFHAVLRRALFDAERKGKVTRNVATLVDAPARRKQEAASLTTEQAGKVLSVLEGHRLRALFTVAVAMGLRRGEIVGLRWENVDLEAGVVRIRQQLQRVKGRGLVVQDLKTDRSRRTLKIPPVVLDALREHARTQKAERLKAGSRWTDSGFVFTSATGAPLDGRNLLRVWKAALTDAGVWSREAQKRGEVPAMTFHTSRHTAASFMLAQGASIYDVKENHGHSQIALTANTYGHLMDELRDATATRVDVAMRAAFAAGKAAKNGGN